MVATSQLPERIGRYKIVRELGQGAMGRVLQAHDPVLERDVALKHLRTDLPLTPDQRDQLLNRMRQEARASARVSHPNLVALHDMGEDPAVGLYLVFEYVEGPTLKEELERGPLAPDAVATIAREVGGGLRLLHEAGVIHRDVKPENIILSVTGAKITDFGIARVPDSTLTGSGNILGTPAYSAPEAIRGGKFSPYSDQFSMAATLYEALSGRRAFPGDDAVFVATKIATEEPPKIAAVCNVPLAVDTVLARGLAKHPPSRCEDCEQFGHLLAEAIAPPPRPSQPTLPDAVHSVPVFTPSPMQKTPIVVAVALGAAGMWAGNQWLRPAPPPAQVSVVAPVEPVAPTVRPQETVAPVAWLAERPKRPASNSDPEEDDKTNHDDDDDESEELELDKADVKGRSKEKAR